MRDFFDELAAVPDTAFESLTVWQYLKRFEFKRARAAWRYARLSRTRKAQLFLEKAQYDSFDYLVILQDGSRLHVSALMPLKEGWMRATLIDPCWGCQCPRGIDIRKDWIVAVADAPNGS